MSDIDPRDWMALGTSFPTARLDVAGAAVVSADSASDALRITQTGAGNALVADARLAALDAPPPAAPAWLRKPAAEGTS